MKPLLLSVAIPVAAMLAAPVAAQTFVAADETPSFEFRDQPRFDRDLRRGHRDGDRRDHRRRHRRGDTVVIGTVGWNEGWALYNNRTFESDSYNDWWHDRPERAYPRWLQTNGNCERLWWSGSGWRC